MEPGCRLRRARGPGAAQHFLRGQGPAAAHPQPSLDRRNGCPLRRPLPRAQLAELLRHRRIPGGPIRQLAGTGFATAWAKSTTCPPSSPTPAATPAPSRRYLHARGRLVDPGQALGFVERHQLHPPQPPPGDFVLHHRRRTTTTASTGTSTWTAPSNSRPRPPASCSPAPTRAATTRTPRKWPRASAPRTTSTSSAPGWTSHSTAARAASRKRTSFAWPPVPSNLRGNAFSRKRTAFTRESEAIRDADSRKGRTWVVSNPESTNRLGHAVAYKLHPAGQPTLLADEDSSIYRRATFASKALWVTRPRRTSATRPATS